MDPAPAFLDTLKRAADGANVAEDAFRREIAQRAKALETERVFAFRRLNLMAAIVEAITGAADEPAALAEAASVLCARLGWSTESEAREAVLARFAAVARSVAASVTPSRAQDAPEPDVIGALGEFERWYAATHETPFWGLFDTYLTETPRVDF